MRLPSTIQHHRLSLAALMFGLSLTSSVQAADQALIDAARKEGQVVWYTTQIINQLVAPVASAFEAKYGVKVSYARADASEVALRVSNEAKAGKMMADIFDGTLTSAALKKQGLVLQWLPDSAKRLPKQYVDAEGYWAATNLYVLTPGYNTSLIKPADAPKTLQDLLNPKLKGKIVWSSSAGSASGVPGFVGLILNEMGEDKGLAFLRELSKQNVAGVPVAARQVLDQVIAGEYALALSIFNNHAVISAAQGAPSAWIPMNPALGTLSVASVTKGAPHENAGKLLLDFLVSEEGQKMFRDADYMPVDPNIPPRDPSLRPDGEKFRAIYLTPETLESTIPKWAAIAKDIFR